MAQPEDFDYLSLLDDRYASVRKFAPLLLTEFEFHAAPATADLMEGLDVLRELNATGKRTMPDGAPTGFVKPRWRPHVIGPEGIIDRHFYELCTLSELRGRMRAGDVWVRGSRQYRDFETYLIPIEAFATLQKEPLSLDSATDLPEYMAERRQCLQAKMEEVASKARKNKLVDVSLADMSCGSRRLRRRLRRPLSPLPRRSIHSCPTSRSPTCWAKWTAGRDSPSASSTRAPWRHLNIGKRC